MRKAKEVEGRRRPECQSERNQTNYGKNRSGTQRCKCNECGHTYTLNPKNRAYPDEVRNQAIKTYYSGGYLDVIYPGRHVRNMRNKSDTFTVEGGNADLRHYIPVLARRSRCFARTLETLQAVVEVFVGAYNRFGAANHAYRQRRPTGGFPFALVDFL